MCPTSQRLVTERLSIHVTLSGVRQSPHLARRAGTQDMIAAVRSLADGDFIGVDEPALAVPACRQLRQQAVGVR